MSTVSKYTQANRFARIDFDELPGKEPLLLVGFEGTEALSELFSFRLEAVAPIEEEFDPELILGGRATLTFGLGDDPDRSHPRTVHGIVPSIREIREDERFVWYEFELAPSVWKSGQNRRYRIFQTTPLPLIIETLLGADVDVAALSASPPRNYCVQYGESDLACTMRLIEEAGYYFYFPMDATEGSMGGRLRVRDDSTTAPSFPNLPPIAYLPVRGQTYDPPHIWSMVAARSLTASSVRVLDRAFQTPALDTEESRALPELLQSNGRRLLLKNGRNDAIDVCEYPSGHVKYYDSISQSGGAENLGAFQDQVRETSALFAEARAGEIALNSIRYAGASNSTGLVPGYSFELTGHRRASGRHLVVRATHSLRMSPFVSDNGVSTTYENRFEAIPIALPFRSPRKTPRPRVLGHQTAVVVGLDGKTTTPDDHIFSDKFGRVRVKFPWCENDNNSCWIRVAHSWAGKRWGTQFVPRAGQEVVIGFEDGDPDRPLIYGSVYNGDNLPPFPPDDFKNRSGIMSCTNGSTIPGAPLDFSGFAISDQKGKEYVQVRSAQTLIQSAGDEIFVVSPVGLYTYLSDSQITLLGGLLGVGVPDFGDLGASVSIQADVTGVWNPVSIHRPMLSSFETNGNYGGQLNIVFGNTITMRGITYETYGSALKSLVLDRIPKVRLAANLLGVQVGKVEEVSGHCVRSASMYDYSAAGRCRIAAAGSFPNQNAVQKTLSVLNTAIGVSLLVIPGISTVPPGSACGYALGGLEVARSLTANLIASLQIGQAILQKAATLRSVASLLQNALRVPKQACPDYMPVCASWYVKEAGEIAEEIGKSLAELSGLTQAAARSPIPADYFMGGVKSADNYSFASGNQIVEAQKSLVAKSQSATVEAERFLAMKTPILSWQSPDDEGASIFACEKAVAIQVGTPDNHASLKAMANFIGEKSVEIAAGPSKLTVGAKVVTLNIGEVQLFEIKENSICLKVGDNSLKLDQYGLTLNGGKIVVEALDEINHNAPQQKNNA